MKEKQVLIKLHKENVKYTQKILKFKINKKFYLTFCLNKKRMVDKKDGGAFIRAGTTIRDYTVGSGRLSGRHMAMTSTSGALRHVVMTPTSYPPCVIFPIRFKSANFEMR